MSGLDSPIELSRLASHRSLIEIQRPSRKREQDREIAKTLESRRHAIPTCERFTSRGNNRDKALKVSLQNLLDSPLIAFMWGFSRCWSVRVD
jgi:hypothetical protein